jgi:hypothetical protein
MDAPGKSSEGSRPPPQAVADVIEIQTNENIVSHRSRHPAAGSFDQQLSIELGRSVTSACLRKGAIFADEHR